MMNMVLDDTWMVKIEYDAVSNFVADTIDYGTISITLGSEEMLLSNDDMINDIMHEIFTKYGAKFTFEYLRFEKVTWYLNDCANPGMRRHDITDIMNEFFYYDRKARYGF